MKIVVYTHSDVDWVWEPWLKQTNKYFSTVPKVVFLDEGASFDKEYTAVTYDDTNGITRTNCPTLKNTQKNTLVYVKRRKGLSNTSVNAV